MGLFANSHHNAYANNTSTEIKFIKEAVVAFLMGNGNVFFPFLIIKHCSRSQLISHVNPWALLTTKHWKNQDPPPGWRQKLSWVSLLEPSQSLPKPRRAIAYYAVQAGEGCSPAACQPFDPTIRAYQCQRESRMQIRVQSLQIPPELYLT